MEIITSLPIYLSGNINLVNENKKFYDIIIENKIDENDIGERKFTVDIVELTSSHNVIDIDKNVKNNLCFNCSEPVGIEYKRIRRSNVSRDKFGYFCSYPCALRYIIDEIWCGRQDIESMFHEDVRKIYGSSTKVVAAPHRSELKKFGGDMKIEEFKEILKSSIKKDN